MRENELNALIQTQVETVKLVMPLVTPLGSRAYLEEEFVTRTRALPNVPGAKVAPLTSVASKARPLESAAMVPPDSSNLSWTTRVLGVTETSAESGPVPMPLE